MSERARVLDSLAGATTRRRATHPLRVAVDGITAAGKSTFAAELTHAVRRLGRVGLHLSTDDFHHQRAHRHRDTDAARGYYRDAYDLELFRRLVLDPLGPDGDLHYRARSHDLRSDELLDEPALSAAADAIVVVDGSFLQSAVLDGAWDVVIWLDVPFEVAVARAMPRDDALFGGPDAVRSAYADRYHAAGQLYLAERDPAGSADVVIDNRDLDRPVVVRRFW